MTGLNEVLRELQNEPENPCEPAAHISSDDEHTRLFQYDIAGRENIPEHEDDVSRWALQWIKPPRTAGTWSQKEQPSAAL